MTGKPYHEQRQLAVDTVMVESLWNRVKQHPAFAGRLPKTKRTTIEIDDFVQTFPTESAERAKEQKKKNK